MATPQWLQMLDQSQRHSAQFLGMVTGQMESAARIQLAGEEFKANQAYRMATLAEQSRVNDARIADISLRNKVLANKHAMDMELQPLKIREAELRLESARAAQERGHKANIRAEFDSITGPYDTVVGSNFMTNKNPEYAKAYLDYKGDWKSFLEAGGQFDDEAFSKGIEELNDSFRGKNVEQEGYNPEFSFLLGQFDKKLQARHEAENPAFAGSITGVKAGLLMGDEEAFAKGMSQWGDLFDEQQTLQLSLGRDAISAYDNQIERLGKDYQYYQTLLSKMDEGTAQYEEAKAKRDETLTQLNDVYTQRQETFKSVLTGQKISDIKPQETPTVDPLAEKLAAMEKAFESQQNARISGEGLKEKRENNRATKKVNDVVSEFQTTLAGEEFNPLAGFNPDIYFGSSTIPQDFNAARGVTGIKPIDWFFGGSKEERNVPDKVLRSIVYNNVSDLETDTIAALVFNHINQDRFDKVSNSGIEQGEGNFDERPFIFGNKLGNLPNRANAGVFKDSTEVRDYVNEDGISESERRSRAIKVYSSFMSSYLEAESRIK